MIIKYFLGKSLPFYNRSFSQSNDFMQVSRNLISYLSFFLFSFVLPKDMTISLSTEFLFKKGDI